MDRDEDHARLRDEENRELFAMRREEERMEAVAREMEDGVDALGEHERRAERSIDDEWRKEHWGHEPERAPFWRSHLGRGAREDAAPGQKRGGE